MFGKKYVSDYKTEDRIDENGKVRTTVKYIGNYYTYIIGDDKMKKTKRVYFISWLLSAVCFIVSLMTPSAFMQECVYVSVPAGICFLPMMYLAFALYNFFMTNPPYTRERRDAITDRIAKTSFLGMAFSVLSLIGAIIAFFSEDMPAIDAFGYICLASLAGMFSGFLIVFLNRKSVEMQEIS